MRWSIDRDWGGEIMHKLVQFFTLCKIYGPHLPDCWTETKIRSKFRLNDTRMAKIRAHVASPLKLSLRHNRYSRYAKI